MKLTPIRLAAAGGAISLATVAALVGSATASADVHINLPSQTDRKSLPGGLTVSVTRSGEKATISPSMGGTPLHRNAMVSAAYTVHTTKKVDKIRIQAGYIVGCQVNLSGISGSGNGGGTYDQSKSTPLAGTAGAGTSLTIGPGQAVNYYVADRESADAFGNDSHSSKIDYKETDHGRLSYTNSTMMVNGCGGYAQARSFANIIVQAKQGEQYLTVYGKPFSLG